MPRPETQPTVLVIDPSAEARALLRELLARVGIEASESDSISDATTQSGAAPADAIVLDGDAFSAEEVEQMMTTTAVNGVATVVVSTNRPKGAQLFVRKPYHFRDLVHRIWAALEEKRADSGDRARAAA